MKKRFLLLALVISFVLLAPYLLTGEDITLRIHFFQGTWIEGQPGLIKVTVLTTSSNPALAELKTIADRPESELKIAVTEALLDILDLRTVEDLFPMVLTWNGIDPGLSDTVVRKSLVFRFAFIPKRISPQEIALRVALFKSKEGSLRTGDTEEKQVQDAAIKVVRDEKMMERILDQALSLEIGDPVIVGIPYEDHVYFMMILLTSGSLDSKQGASKAEKMREPTKVIAAPKAIRKVLPAYPEKLRQQGVEGTVELRVSIDKKGIVQEATVLESIHPYLDYAAVQALRQWEFEPVLREEKPVPVAFMVAVNFDPKTWNLQQETTEIEEIPPTGLESDSQARLRMILDHCAEYCQKLAGLALDFICEETIKEIHYNFSTEEGGWVLYIYSPPSPPGGPITSARTPLFDPKLTEKNSFVCDYLLVKKGETIEERRILLQEDGRTMPDRETLLEEKKFSVLMPLFAPVQLLDRDRQPQFNYTLLKEKKVNKKKAYLIEAVPKSSDVAGIQCGRIWVDVKTFQILQCEIEGVPLEGYEDILKDCVRFNIEPLFTTTYQYKIKRKDVLFPFLTTIRVAYKGKGAPTKLTKLKTKMTYKKYKIFTVESEQVIKKGDSGGLSSTEMRQLEARFLKFLHPSQVSRRESVFLYHFLTQNFPCGIMFRLN